MSSRRLLILLHPMSLLVKASVPLIRVGFICFALSGCTTMLAERQGMGKPSQYKDCPDVYSLTRMDAASVGWSFSDSAKPTDRCLAHFYPKAAKDNSYHSATQIMTPLYILSFPFDILVDTLTLPFAIASMD